MKTKRKQNEKKLIINITALSISVVILALVFPLRQGLFGSNKLLQQNISTFLFIASSLVLVANLMLLFIKNGRSALVYGSIIEVILLALIALSSYVIFTFDYSHSGMHEMEAFFPFASAAAVIIMVLAVAFPLMQVCKTFIKQKKLNNN